MQLDDIVKLHDEQLIYESKSTIVSTLNKLRSYNWGPVKKFLKGNFQKFVDYVEEKDIDMEVVSIFNKHLKTNFKSVKDILLMRVLENNQINEGFSDWWKEASGNLYSSLAFYPILMVFLELDKLIKSLEGASPQAVVIYSIIWMAVITGKVVSGQLINKNVPEQEKEAKKLTAAAHPSQAAR